MALFSVLIDAKNHDYDLNSICTIGRQIIINYNDLNQAKNKLSIEQL